MEPTRARVMHDRLSVLASAIMTTLFFFMFRWSGSFPVRKHNLNHSYFFGDISGWPHFMRTFMPLDLLICFVALAVTMRLMFHGIRDDTSVRNMLLGALVCFVCFGAALGSVMYGWYMGVELAFRVPFFLGYMLVQAVIYIGVLVLIFGVLALAGYLIWKGTRHTVFGDWARRAIRFFTAENYPE